MKENTYLEQLYREAQDRIEYLGNKINDLENEVNDLRDELENERVRADIAIDEKETMEGELSNIRDENNAYVKELERLANYLLTVYGEHSHPLIRSIAYYIANLGETIETNKAYDNLLENLLIEEVKAYANNNK